MNLTQHNKALVRDLKHQPTSLIVAYILIGRLGVTLALMLEFNPVLKVIVSFLSGGLIGLSAEKLVSKRIRNIAHTLLNQQSNG